MTAGLEDFLKGHEHTIAAIEAASTFAAVVISLWLAIAAQRANKTSLEASATIGTIMHSSLEGKAKPRYVTASVTNTGIMPLSIPLSFFHWHAPFQRGTIFVLPHDYSQADRLVPQQKYPVEIKPRTSATFFLTALEMFREMHRENFVGDNLFDRIRFKFVSAWVITDDGMKFRVTIEQPLRKEPGIGD